MSPAGFKCLPTQASKISGEEPRQVQIEPVVDPELGGDQHGSREGGELDKVRYGAA